ncbi:MAG: deoxyribonuclease IV [Candidatus Phytoplasma sp.]|nr:deoxyribonuclease IV [Phytoplasma sp.]
MIIIGSHVSMSGDQMYLGSVLEAQSYGANAFMVYTGAPQNTIRKSIDRLKINEAIQKMEELDIDLSHVVVHAPYIINLANPDQEKRDFAISFLTEEIKRTAAMQISQMVLHPGSAVGKNREEAIKWIGEGLNQIFKNTEGLSVKIALETMAGKGNEVGKTFEEIKAIIDLVEDKKRISVCFDTCHVNDAGYDIKNDFNGVIESFDQIVGIEFISVIHVNDSKNILGAAKDRHENLGFGTIGFQALLDIIYDKRFSKIPKILETPYVSNKAPYKEEIKMIKNRLFNPELKNDLERESN